ncbi:MAG: hypothetical protein LUD18_10885 [Lachnospiraceae bacterium]|nr:hypothetical protein [Lachnospiraceae bacterium]
MRASYRKIFPFYEYGQSNDGSRYFLMPQILFSGLIFKLDGATKLISRFAICRWSMEGYGTTSNLNELQLQLQQQGVMITHEVEAFYDFTLAMYAKDLAGL